MFVLQIIGKNSYEQITYYGTGDERQKVRTVTTEYKVDSEDDSAVAEKTEVALILKAIQIFIICRADITMQRWEEFLRRNLVKRYMNKYHKHVCITSEIQDNAYDELMNWLESKCDSFSFCLPHFGKVVVTESNADIYPEYEIGYVEEDEESKKDYEQYRRRVQKYLENISEYIIENYVDIEYCETISGYEKEIFIIKFNNITKKFFENVKDLYCWLYPEFPEDLT